MQYKKNFYFFTLHSFIEQNPEIRLRFFYLAFLKAKTWKLDD